MKNKQTAEKILAFANELELAGLHCYGTEQTRHLHFMSYLHFGNETGVGYAQYDPMEGWSFSSVHKPCRACGTSFQLETKLQPSVLMALHAMSTVAPHWASAADREAVRKYSSIEDFVNSQHYKPVRIVKEWAL